MKILVNGELVTDSTVIEYVDNPKRVGCNAYERYELYQGVTTIGEYFGIAEAKHAKADLRWDHDKGFMKLVTDE